MRQPLQRPADHPGQGPHDVLGEHGDGDEQQQRTQAHEQQPAVGGAVAEDAVSQSTAAQAADQQRAGGGEPGEPRGWQGGTLLKSRHRRHPRGAQSRHQRREKGDSNPHEDCDEDRARRERQPRRGDVGAHRLEQGVDALGDRQAGEDAYRRGGHAQAESLAHHGGEHLTAARPQGAQHGELAPPLRDRDGESVEDDEGAHEYAHAGKRQQHRLEK